METRLMVSNARRSRGIELWKLQTAGKMVSARMSSTSMIRLVQLWDSEK